MEAGYVYKAFDIKYKCKDGNFKRQKKNHFLQLYLAALPSLKM